MRRPAYWKAGETELICLHGGLRLAQGRYLGHGSNLVQTTSAIDMMRTMDKDAYAEYQKMGKNDDGGLSSWNLSSSESGEKLQTFKIFFLNLQKFQWIFRIHPHLHIPIKIKSCIFKRLIYCQSVKGTFRARSCFNFSFALWQSIRKKEPAWVHTKIHNMWKSLTFNSYLCNIYNCTGALTLKRKCERVRIRICKSSDFGKESKGYEKKEMCSKSSSPWNGGNVFVLQLYRQINKPGGTRTWKGAAKRGKGSNSREGSGFSDSRFTGSKAKISRIRSQTGRLVKIF
mgnify:CR=1 FL=1